jgi:phosphoglycolate phosphatase
LPIAKKYGMVLFDLDGTLTDPKIGITRSVQYALTAFGINEPCLDNLINFIGPPLKDSFKEFYGFDEGQADAAITKYREYFAEQGLYENVVYPFIPQLLDTLLDRGKNLIVATSKPTIFAEKILTHFGLLQQFSFVAGSSLDGSRVKKSDVIRYALAKVATKNYDQIVMVGDRKHDVIGAKEVGIDSVAVLYGYGSREELAAANPTYIVDSVEELERFLL